MPPCQQSQDREHQVRQRKLMRLPGGKTLKLLKRLLWCAINEISGNALWFHTTRCFHRACQAHMAKLVEALHSATSATLEMAPVSQGHENMKTKYTFLSTLCQYTGQAAKPLNNLTGGKRPLDFSKTSKNTRGNRRSASKVLRDFKSSFSSFSIFNLGIGVFWGSSLHRAPTSMTLSFDLFFFKENRKGLNLAMKSQVSPAPSYHWLVLSTFNIHTNTYQSDYRLLTQILDILV